VTRAASAVTTVSRGARSGARAATVRGSSAASTGGRRHSGRRRREHQAKSAAALRLRPEVARTVDALRKAGALAAQVTGSGPTVFGLFEHRAAAEEAIDHVPVDAEPLGLPVGPVWPPDLRSLVPVQTEPAEILEHAVERLLGDTRRVRVLDAQDERAAVPTSPEP